MRGLLLAIQFLTRLPVPAVVVYDERALARSAIWFPVVGMLVGACVTLAMAAGLGIARWHGIGASGDWLAALAGTVIWVWVTGGLHVDGLADLADALGAAHRDPARFAVVLKDPHTGAFGVMAVVLLLLSKLILLMLWASASLPLSALLLVAAWGRWGAMVWARALPALTGGYGERFAWSLRRADLAWSGLLLALLSLWQMPVLLPAGLLAAGLWYAFLRRRLGGMCGDALGAGIEVAEVGMLLVGVVGALS